MLSTSSNSRSGARNRRSLFGQGPLFLCPPRSEGGVLVIHFSIGMFYQNV